MPGDMQVAAVGVAIGVPVGVAVGVAVGWGGQVAGAGASFTTNLRPSPVPVKVMQYLAAVPSMLRTTSIDAGPFGTANGSPLPSTLSQPGLTLATLTPDGPPGALAFLYLRMPCSELQRLAGNAKTTVPLPLSKLSEESAPPMGSPSMMMPGSLVSKTNFGVFFSRRPLARDGVVGGKCQIACWRQ